MNQVWATLCRFVREFAQFSDEDVEKEPLWAWLIRNGVCLLLLAGAIIWFTRPS
jgi:hypothetical protein